jgi:hypothetical protein
MQSVRFWDSTVHFRTGIGGIVFKRGKTDTAPPLTNCREWPSINNESLSPHRRETNLGNPEDPASQSRPAPGKYVLPCRLAC